MNREERAAIDDLREWLAKLRAHLATVTANRDALFEEATAKGREVARRAGP